MQLPQLPRPVARVSGVHGGEPNKEPRDEELQKRMAPVHGGGWAWVAPLEQHLTGPFGTIGTPATRADGK